MNDEMHMDREEAERLPCRYELPSVSRRRRAAWGADDSHWRCGARPGQHCRDPRTDRVLERQAAHLVRLRDAGRVDAKTEGSTCAQ